MTNNRNKTKDKNPMRKVDSRCSPPVARAHSLLMSFAISLSSSICLCVGNGAPAVAESSSWGLDPSHCKAIFVSTHDGLSPVTGWFDKVRGALEYDGKNLSKAHIIAHIETASIDSGSEMRDFHLRSENFFDVKNFPEMAFESKVITPTAPGKFKMTGILEIRGIKKTVVLDCQGPTGPIVDDHKQKLIGVVAKTRINKKDFGMTWNREVAKGVFMVSDQVDITLEIEAVQVDMINDRLKLRNSFRKHK